MDFSIENILTGLAALPVAPVPLDALAKGTKVPCIFVHPLLGPLRAELWMVDQTVHVSMLGLAGTCEQDLSGRNSYQEVLAPHIYPVAAYATLVARFALETGLCPR